MEVNHRSCLKNSMGSDKEDPVFQLIRFGESCRNNSAVEDDVDHLKERLVDEQVAQLRIDSNISDS